MRPGLVAHGKSLYGIPWRIDAREELVPRGRQATFGFSVGRSGENNDAGYFTTLSLPINRRFVLTGNQGSGTDPRLEGDVSGIARRQAVRIVAAMSKGPPLEIETQIAAPGLRRRYPWLRNLEFFNLWYPAELEARRLIAYDRSGRVLGAYP